MSNSIPDQYSYLFEDIEVEVSELYKSDKALHDLSALIVEREAKLGEYSVALSGYKTRIQEIEVEMADLRGKMKSADVELRGVLGLITQFRYREDTRERQIRDAKTRIEKRKAVILRNEVQRRLKSVGKQITYKQITYNRGRIPSSL